ncbi:sugar transferase [Kitasatospora sp. MBT63]|uniref:sugar transferase n=1 Tax=Kitasatospora sp. MBT63 TaxID=1444768 RepID=UPI001E3D9D59|nr:sugar transferase [Kitasatospora sp. MBT63]
MTNEADRASSQSMDDEAFDGLLDEIGLGETDLIQARASLSPETLSRLDGRFPAAIRRRSTADLWRALRSRWAKRRRRQGASRVQDLLIVLLAGTVAVPLGLLIAIVVRGTMGGPVFVRQARSGRHGREFQILKFRTMRDRRYDLEPDASRITRFGALLRGSGLDELPQLWNVARGDMAVVGPRPTLPEQIVHYSPRQRGRLDIRPGITGWAQVCGRNSITWPERMELDLWYIANRSVLLDLRILTLTAKAMLRPTDIPAVGNNADQRFPVRETNPDHPVREASPAVPRVAPWQDLALKQQREETAEA